MPNKLVVVPGERYWYDVTFTNTSPTQNLTRVVLTDYFNLQSQCVAYLEANHSSCEPVAMPPSVICDIDQVFPPSASLVVRFTFDAVTGCTGQQNRNRALVVGYHDSQQTAPAEAIAYVTIRGPGRAVEAGAGQPAVPDDGVIITNAGAWVRWVYNGQPGQAQSNPVSNPASRKLFLPFVKR